MSTDRPIQAGAELDLERLRNDPFDCHRDLPPPNRSLGLMSTATPDPNVLADLRASHDAELRTAARLNLASWVISLAAILTLLTLLFVFRRASIWLALLTAFSVGTRLSSLVTHYRFLVPEFLLELGSTDPVRVVAARTLLEERRGTIVRPILRDRIEPSGPESIAAATPEFLLSVARQWDIPARARFARRWLLGYLVVAAALIVGLALTRGAYDPRVGGW